MSDDQIQVLKDNMSNLYYAPDETKFLKVEQIRDDYLDEGPCALFRFGGKYAALYNADPSDFVIATRL